jgi:DNA N-6-adenine-methyltransferase (Dam)
VLQVLQEVTRVAGRKFYLGRLVGRAGECAVNDRPVMLTRYDAARFALAEARQVDEVKDIIDKMAAVLEYARRAKDTEMLDNATGLRFDAERKGGELLREMAAKGERDRGHGDRQSAKAKSRPTTQLSDLGVTKTESSKWQKLAALPPDEFKVRVEHAKARVRNMTTSAPSLLRNGGYTGENEWFTPREWIERARAVLGDIDLDPASHQLAQRIVCATRFFTVADDGLKQPWRGKIWLNPPYQRSLLQPFVDKLLSSYAAGEVSQAILLTHSYTDVAWFHAAGRAAACVCFPRRRIQFIAPSGDKCAQMQSQVFFFFGADDSAFCRVFDELGLIMRAV